MDHNTHHSATDACSLSLETKLNAISHRIREMDFNNHTALLSAIIGGLKGHASYDPDGIRAAVNTIEVVVTDFENNLRDQG